MNLQQFTNRHLKKRSIFSYLLFPFSLVYIFILMIRIVLFFFTKKTNLKEKAKIICIGNIVAGGSGKTPFVLFLLNLLNQSSKKTAVISRGYHGQYEKTNKLISDRDTVFPWAKSAGDEPYLIAAKNPGIPVVVGKNRQKSISLLLKKYDDLDFILMDDGFQHLKIKPNYSFLLFNALNPIGNGFVFPAGILREPLFRIKKASCLVINGSETFKLPCSTYNLPLIHTDYTISKFLFDNKTEKALSYLNTKKLALMSAIGLPESFEKSIKKSGLSFVKHFIFSDHFNYQDKNSLKQINSDIKEQKIDYLIVTEKDFSKLTHIDHCLPIIVAQASFSLNSQDTCLVKKILSIN